MMHFGNARPCKWATATRALDLASHLYTLAWVANAYDVPKIGTLYVEAPTTPFQPRRFTDGPERIKRADRTWGAPFRAALMEWLVAVNATLDDEIVQAKSPVAVWNNALECPDFTARYAGDPARVRFVLTHVEPAWASQAIAAAYTVRDMVARENVLLRAENIALHGKTSLLPPGWARWNDRCVNDRFERFLDVGHLLAYAAWTADWLSHQPEAHEAVKALEGT